MRAEEDDVAKRRDQIRMTDDEVWKLIEDRKSLQVATLNGDGSPHLTTLWFAVIDGRITFETYTKSQKVVNLRRDPRIAVLVEAGTRYDELRGVSINGRAELVDDPDRVHVIAREVMGRNQPGLSAPELDGLARRMAAKRSGVIVHPEKIVSWDHRKLAGVGL
jgi:PPOX class probable F420-dependent enzyme